jgi:hypothetical protein
MRDLWREADDTLGVPDAARSAAIRMAILTVALEIAARVE